MACISYLMYKGEIKMLYGPQEYAKLSSEALKFITAKSKLPKSQIIKPYEYMAPGANLPKLPEVKGDDKIHKFLSQCAGTDEVFKEFGKNLNISV